MEAKFHPSQNLAEKLIQQAKDRKRDSWRPIRFLLVQELVDDGEIQARESHHEKKRYRIKSFLDGEFGGYVEKFRLFTTIQPWKLVRIVSSDRIREEKEDDGKTTSGESTMISPNHDGASLVMLEKMCRMAKVKGMDGFGNYLKRLKTLKRRESRRFSTSSGRRLTRRRSISFLDKQRSVHLGIISATTNVERKRKKKNNKATTTTTTTTTTTRDSFAVGPTYPPPPPPTLNKSLTEFTKRNNGGTGAAADDDDATTDHKDYHCNILSQEEDSNIAKTSALKEMRSFATINQRLLLSSSVQDKEEEKEEEDVRRRRRTRKGGEPNSVQQLERAFSSNSWVMMSSISIDDDAVTSIAQDIICMSKKDLKASIRGHGIPHVARKAVWTFLVCKRELEEEGDTEVLEDELESEEEILWHGYIPMQEDEMHLMRVPDFGGMMLLHSHPLTPVGKLAVKRLLCVIQTLHPHITYCPMLPDLAALLLHLPMEDWRAFLLLKEILRRSKDDDDDDDDEFYVPLSGERFMCHVESLQLLLEARCRSLAKHIKRLGIDMVETFEVWLARLFVEFLSYPTVLRIIDVFLLEGSKVLFRFSLAVLIMHQHRLLKCQSASQFKHILPRLMKENTPTEELFEIAFGLPYFSRKMLKRMHAQHKITEVPFAKVPVFYTPAFDEKESDLLKIGVIRAIWNNLDPVHGIQDPVCLFKSKEDGYSLASLQRTIMSKWGGGGSSGKNKDTLVLLVFKTSKGAVFGGFLHLEKKTTSGVQKHKREAGDDELQQSLRKKASSSGLDYIRLGVQTFLFTIEEPRTKIYRIIPNGSAGSKITPQRQLSCEWEKQQQQANDDNDVEHLGTRRRRRSSRDSLPLMTNRMHSRSVSQPPATSRSPRYRHQQQQNVPSSSCTKKSAKEGEDNGNALNEVKMGTKNRNEDDHDDDGQHQYGADEHSPDHDGMIKSVKSMWIEFSESRLAFGGPNETAFFLDDKLHHGFTEACSLFGSPPLTSSSFTRDKRRRKKQHFKCVLVEAWGLTQ